MDDNFLKVGDTWINKRDIIHLSCPCNSTIAKMHLRRVSKHCRTWDRGIGYVNTSNVFEKDEFPKEYEDICRYTAELKKKHNDKYK